MGVSRTRPEDRFYTIEEYERLPDDDRYHVELVRGRLVREARPGNDHGRVQLNLAAELRQYVRKHRLGAVRVETGYALVPSVATVRGPDISYITRERIPPEGLPHGFPHIPPDLAIEVASRSRTAAALREKVAEYFDSGVRQVWIVYLRTHKIAVHHSRSEVRMLNEDDEFDGGDVVPGFRLPVSEIFAD